MIAVMDKHLEKTLIDLGVQTPGQLEVIAHSEPSPENNRKVYALVNELLGKLVGERDLGSTIHITGELRALSDPRHQDICIENYRRHKTAVTFVGYVPVDHRAEPYLLLERDASAWQASWRASLTAFRMPANGEVNVFATDEMEKLHYSVFPDNYALLQEWHIHEDHSKRVWLIRSPAVHASLERRAQRTLARATQIPPFYFRRLAMYAASDEALDLLARLDEGDQIPSPSHDGLQWFQTLQTLGFVSSNGMLGITAAGQAYLNSYLNEQ
jgi:hypothetical protein